MILTTDHSAPGHLEPAIVWYRENHMICERPLIPALRRRFNLSALEACQVMRLANLAQDWGGADA